MLQVLPDATTMRASFACVLSLLLVCPVVSHADAYGDARSEMIAAYRAEDFNAMRAAAQEALSARPGYPGARFNLALAELLDGDAEKSLRTLNDMVTAGIDYGIEDMEEFAPLQQLAAWPKYKAAVAMLHEPTGNATVAYSYDVADFVPEGIAINDDGELFLGSIHRGELVKIGDGSEVVSDATSNDHWSVFGMRFDADGGLWFASASIPEFRGNDDPPNGRTGLFRVDLETREITDRALLPPGNTPMVLGDLVLGDANTIYATESLTGILYRYSITERKFTELVSAGTLRSMQGLVLDESGKHLYVADYVGGLFRIRLDDGDVTRVTAAESVTLFGIDGLYSYGDELIIIQNGVSPNKVVALKLSDDGLKVTEQRILAMNLPEFDEPTLGVVVGDEFYFVANSHWNRFDREGKLPDGLTPPIILKLPLN